MTDEGPRTCRGPLPAAYCGKPGVRLNMKRREFVAGLLAGVVLASPAFADDIVESIVRQLKKQGFKAIIQERTLLGRVRIAAKRKDGTREIILNPRTGEILRDLWTPIDGGKGGIEIIRDPSGSGSGGSGTSGGSDGGGGHDDDEDEEDDHEDDHESGGSGSGKDED